MSLPENIDKILELRRYGPFKDWEQPGWDEYLMSIAVSVSMKSPDPSTKHGALIVDKYHSPVSFGYNGPPPDCEDDKIPLSRPEKYPYMKHAEDNAMKFAKRDLTGCVIYVTGHPCHDCFSDMLTHRISKVVYGPIGSDCVTKESREIIDFLNKSKSTGKNKIELVPFEGDSRIFDMLERQRDYLEIKLGKKR